MGSSFVRFRGKGFWVSDGLLQDWLHFLVCEVDKQADPPHWLLQLRDHWDEQRRLGVIGIIDADLDRLITSDQVDTVLAISGAATERIRSYGDAIPLAERESWPVYGVPFGDLPVALMVRMSRYFVKLLQGHITTTPSTSFRIELQSDSAVEAELGKDEG
jgi:hypothetical protein